MEKKFNIFEEITKIYSIYLSKKDKNLDIKKIFEDNDFFKIIYPELDKIIDYIIEKKNKKNQVINENKDSQVINENKDSQVINENKDSQVINENKDNNYIGNRNYDYKEHIIKPLIKKIYKKLAVICHPDKSNNSEMFILVSECYQKKILIGLIYFCIELKINLNFIEVNNIFVEYLIIEFKHIINQILKE